MKIEYYIFNPCGNITALVTSSIEKRFYNKISTAIMKNDNSVEQVGFVDLKEKTVKLNMSGDEFCGNAAMSAAVLSYITKGNKDKTEIEVDVLPMGEKVTVTVKKTDDGYSCIGLFKTPAICADYSFKAGNNEYSFPVVALNGIKHIVADTGLSEQAARSVIKPAAKKLNTPAAGIMIYNNNTGDLKPLVYVSAANTLFLENSCASGSCAVAAAKCKIGNTITLKEPGGNLEVANKGKYITIGENIKFIKKCLEEI